MAKHVIRLLQVAAAIFLGVWFGGRLSALPHRDIVLVQRGSELAVEGAADATAVPITADVDGAKVLTRQGVDAALCCITERLTTRIKTSGASVVELQAGDSPQSLVVSGNCQEVIKTCGGKVVIVTASQDQAKIANGAAVRLTNLWDRLGEGIKSGAQGVETVLITDRSAEKLGGFASMPNSNIIVCDANTPERYLGLRILRHICQRLAAGHGDVLGLSPVERQTFGSALARSLFGLVYDEEPALQAYWDVTRLVPSHRKGRQDLRAREPELFRELARAIRRYGLSDLTLEHCARIVVCERAFVESTTEALSNAGPRTGKKTVESAEMPGALAPLEGSIRIASNYHGLYEECGCIGPPRGGMLRLIEELSGARGALNVLVGPMLDRRPDLGIREPVAKWTLESLTALPDTLLVPSLSELLTLESCSEKTRENVIAANATARRKGPAVPKWKDVSVPGLGLSRVVGLVWPQTLGEQEHDVIAGLDRWTVTDPSDALQVVVAATPVDMPLVVACSAPTALGALEGRTAPSVVIVGEPKLMGRDYRVVVWPITNAGAQEASVLYVCTRLLNYGYSAVSLSASGQGVVWTHQDRWLNGRPSPDTPVYAKYAELLGLLEVGGGNSAAEQPDAGNPGAVYAGTGACCVCHSVQFERWKRTPHGRALDGLKDVGRHRVRSCVACHVVGFARATGYDMTKPSEHLEHVGCEACHGAASLHAKNPLVSVPVRNPGLQECRVCHTVQHSHLESRPAEYMDRAVSTCRGQ